MSYLYVLSFLFFYFNHYFNNIIYACDVYYDNYYCEICCCTIIDQDTTAPTGCYHKVICNDCIFEYIFGGNGLIKTNIEKIYCSKCIEQKQEHKGYFTKEQIFSLIEKNEKVKDSKKYYYELYKVWERRTISIINRNKKQCPGKIILDNNQKEDCTGIIKNNVMINSQNVIFVIKNIVSDVL